MIRLKRRSFLKILFGFLATFFFYPLKDLLSNLSQGSPKPSKALHQILVPAPGILTLGREYLKIRPNESSIQTLESLLCEKKGSSCSLLAKNLSTQNQAVRKKIREDFKEGKTLKLQGWLLSETELRLCALTFLGQAQGTGSGG